MQSSRNATIAITLWLGTWLLFWPVGGFDFLNFDDDEYVTAAPIIQQGVTWQGLAWCLTNIHAANWHPVTSLSHMLDCELFGLNPRGHHFTNVLLHATNAALLFFLLWRITRAQWASAFAAAVFAWHPLHVESVAWVSERKDVLSTFFWLLTLLAYVRYVKCRDTGDRRNSRLFYTTTLMMFAIGLMSKPMLVTLPFVLLLLDYWPLRRFEIGRAADGENGVGTVSLFRQRLIEKLPFFVLTAAICVITFVVQNKAGAVQDLDRFPFWERASNAAVSYVRYAWKTIWPADLNVLYAHEGSRSLAVVLLSVAVLLAATLLVVRRAKRWPFLFTGWLWFLGTLVPVIGLVQVGIQSLADRYMYVPMIGLLIIFCWGAAALVDKFPNWRAFLRTAAVVVVVACSVLTRQQLGHWRNSETLWTRAIAVAPNNTTAHLMLGTVFEQKNELEKASAHCRAALAVNPNLAQAHYNLGNLAQLQGRISEAVEHYQRALASQPNLFGAHNNLAILYDELGESEKALHHASEAVRRNPNHVVGFCNLALHLIKRNQLPEAAETLSRAVTIEPHNPEPYKLWGNVLAMQEKWEDAIDRYQKALRCNGELHDVHYNLGNCLGAIGRHKEAKQHYEEALRLRPDYEKARAQLHSLAQ